MEKIDYKKKCKELYVPTMIIIETNSNLWGSLCLS